MKSSICYESILGQFYLDCTGKIYVTCGMALLIPGTLSGANTWDIFAKESAQKTKVLENLFDLPWHL